MNLFETFPTRFHQGLKKTKLPLNSLYLGIPNSDLLYLIEFILVTLSESLSSD